PAGSADGLYELLQLAQVAALVDAVAVDAVLADDGVAGIPVGPGLGIEPVEVPRLLVQFLQDPGLRRVVVVASVAEEDHRRLRRDLAPPARPEGLEGV